MFKIREATGLSEINEVILKFATQNETLANLKDIKAANEKKLLVLTDKKQQVKEDLDKMKLEGLEAMSSKQVDDMERSLVQAQQRHSNAKDQHDNLAKMLLDLQAGIEHLCSKLNEITLQTHHERLGVIQKVTQENLVDSLEEARRKMKVLVSEMEEEQDLLAEAMHVITHGSGTEKKTSTNVFKETYALGNKDPIINQNVRVKLPAQEEDPEDEASDVDPEAELMHQAAMRKTKQRFMV